MPCTREYIYECVCIVSSLTSSLSFCISRSLSISLSLSLRDLHPAPKLADANVRRTAATPVATLATAAIRRRDAERPCRRAYRRRVTPATGARSAAAGTTAAVQRRNAEGASWSARLSSRQEGEEEEEKRGEDGREEKEVGHGLLSLLLSHSRSLVFLITLCSWKG